LTKLLKSPEVVKEQPLMVDFAYWEMFPLADDPTEYRLLTKAHVSELSTDGMRFIKIAPEGLTQLAERLFRMFRISCALRISSNWRRSLMIRRVRPTTEPSLWSY